MIELTAEPQRRNAAYAKNATAEEQCFSELPKWIRSHKILGRMGVMLTRLQTSFCVQ